MAQLRVAQPERAGQIEDALAARDEGGRHFGRRVLGQREEDRVRAVRQRIEVEAVHGRIPQALERGHVPRRRAGRPHRGCDPHARMPAEQAQQLDAGIPGRPSHANPNGLGITIHLNA